MTTEGLRAAVERIVADRDFARRVYEAHEASSPLEYDLDPAEWQAVQRAVAADVEAAAGEVVGFQAGWGGLEISFPSVEGLLSARDAGSGMATGRRNYSPLVIKKQIDKSSP